MKEFHKYSLVILIMFCLCLGLIYAFIEIDYQILSKPCEEKGYYLIYSDEPKCYDEYENKYYPLREDGMDGLLIKYKVLDGGK